MKRFKVVSVTLLLFGSVCLFAQDADDAIVKTKDKPERSAFQSTFLIDNPTGVLNTANSLQFDIQHRFGIVNSGNNDLLGLWGASNIRLGLSYSFTDILTVGFGTTKDYRLQDFNLKVGVFQQTRSGSIPVSLTFYGNAAIDAREASFFTQFIDRLSYFSQLIVMRRFNQAISLQIAPSFSHFNMVDSSTTPSNHIIAVEVGGKVNVTDDMAIIADYNQPLGDFSNNPGLALGVEVSTGSHAFQVFVGNYNRILPQANYFLNENKLSKQQILIGFNINRLWNF
ncbi:MAG: hypothetical protein HYX66_07735 [Ignavibacteria bacterium]|nr:hypothetical protein [Ignavibacteria bacterium]